VRKVFKVKKNFHRPVLLREVIDNFKGVNLKVFIDATLGAAGHAMKILEEHEEIEEFIGIDRDVEAFKIAKEELKPWCEKVKIFHGNFFDFEEFFEGNVSGFLFDLGISSMQIESGERGFSFLRDGPLDMRMDIREKLTAEEVVNEFSEKELGKIFKRYGEERFWKRAARAVVKEREKRRIKTTKELADILSGVCRKKRGLHPATLVFQSLRIFVNDELNVLEKTLKKAIDKLFKGGRIAVISFHSLEDRRVKNVFKENEKKKLKIITKKPIRASLRERRENRRSRSAKLRVAERI
jgi:16S rRNA (cytosine1402-N4)-methyltransferase